ncbi:MAG: ATP-binding cassette domain-containing protein [bacterium]|nr:ATP-binding cassette domain-containing protein [bacterium]
MLAFDRLIKRYGDLTALAGCTFGVERGQMLGFLGPNGAGKTTAMRSVFGLVRPTSGTVTWNDEPIGPPTRLRFGYMPEERGLYPRMETREQLVYFGELHGMARLAAGIAADRLLEDFDLGDRAEEPVSNLSHGNQQRVQLAVALMHDPELLVLDEPFSGLDPLAAQTMAGILRRRADEGAAVLFSSHQLDVVEDLCDDVVIINGGEVVLSGDVMELRASSPLRYLEIVGRKDVAWARDLPDVTVVTHDGNRIRLALGQDAQLATMAAKAQEAGDIVVFSVEPPPLSEIFREAVT